MSSAANASGHEVTVSARGEVMLPDNSSIENEFERPSASAAVEIQTSRAMQEVRAAFLMAQQFPRNEHRAFQAVLEACKRKKLAEVAEYEYPRGSERITGPTIRLAEVLKQQWGHIDSGFVEVEQRKGWSTVMAYAVDFQTGARDTKTFQVEHVRHTRQGRRALTDPRDLYELIANQAMRRVRACILSLIPGDVIDAAIAACRKTMSSNEVPIKQRVQKMCEMFADYQVTIPMIESMIGMPLDAISENQLARLRRVYQSLKDGIATREELFRLDELIAPGGGKPSAQIEGEKTQQAPVAQHSKARAVAEKLKGGKAEIVDQQGELSKPDQHDREPGQEG